MENVNDFNDINRSHCGTYFSVGFDFIQPNADLPYELYVNSSSLKDREKFVKLIKTKNFITKEDLKLYEAKYHRLYVPESQRELYIKNVLDWKGKKDNEKISVLKDSAISYLSNVFNKEKVLTTGMLKDNIQRCREVVSQIVDVIENYNVDGLRELIGSLSFHDFYTYDHSINVSMYCIILFKSICPSAHKSEVITAGMGGLFHDLGKIKIPTELLNWTGKLSEEQFEVIKKHPGYGYELLKTTKLDYSKGVDPLLVRRVINEHHENFDGTGYPSKVAYDDIHLLARICAVADFFDAVTTKRSYQDPLSVSDAFSLMLKYT